MNFEFQGKYMIAGYIVCETGLHIGGSTEGFEIGGLYNPVIKDPLTENPYIPGSSLKGKLRHLLEWSLGENDFWEYPGHFTLDERNEPPGFQPCSCGQCPVCIIFGIPPDDGAKEGEPGEGSFATAYTIEKKDEEGNVTKHGPYRFTGPTRLTVRDAFPTKESIAEWERFLGENVHTELKTENVIDRVTAAANPRTMERVPKGSKFKFETVFDIYKTQDKKLLKYLFTAMRLLENSALGGSGSRGHGKVKFEGLSAKFRPVKYYTEGTGEQTIDLKGSTTVTPLLENFEDIDWKIG